VYTELLANVTPAVNAWTNILNFNLDPGIWILMGDMTVQEASNAPYVWEFRFTDGFGTNYGSAVSGARTNIVPALTTRAGTYHFIAVADLSAALLPTNVQMDCYPDDNGSGTMAPLVLHQTPINGVPGATWFMAFVDAQAILNQILAAVQREFPHQ
jgi:hypothetical protein